jgi:hypothetical protein
VAHRLDVGFDIGFVRRLDDHEESSVGIEGVEPLDVQRLFQTRRSGFGGGAGRDRELIGRGRRRAGKEGGDKEVACGGYDLVSFC